MLCLLHVFTSLDRGPAPPSESPAPASAAAPRQNPAPATSAGQLATTSGGAAGGENADTGGLDLQTVHLHRICMNEIMLKNLLRIQKYLLLNHLNLGASVMLLGE